MKARISFEVEVKDLEAGEDMAAAALEAVVDHAGRRRVHSSLQFQATEWELWSEPVMTAGTLQMRREDRLDNA